MKSKPVSKIRCNLMKYVCNIFIKVVFINSACSSLSSSFSESG